MKWDLILTMWMTMVVLGGLFWFLPVMKGADAFFGVPVSDEFYRSDRARRLLLAYRALVVLFCLTLVVPMAYPKWEPLMPLAVCVGVLGMLIAMVGFYRVVLPEEATSTSTAVAAALTPRRPWQYANPPLEMLSLLLLALTAAALWFAPPTLPPSDRKGIVTIVAMQAYMFALMLTFLPAIAQSRVWLPPQDTENFLLLREQYVRTLVGILYFVRIAAMALFGFIAWAFAFSLGKSGVAVASVVFNLVALIGVALYAVRLYQQRKQLRALAGPGWMERTTDSRHWIGGLIYYNRDDPSPLVEKRVGIGWTFNFAQPIVWVWTALMIAAPVLIVALTGGAK